MLTWGRRHPWLFATCCSLAALVACSFAPVWAIWYYSPHNPGCVVGTPFLHREFGTFWEMTRLAAYSGTVMPARLFAELYGPEVAKLSALLAAAGGVGWFVLYIGPALSRKRP
jgi:hypothetical protein